jgi:ribokinase
MSNKIVVVGSSNVDMIMKMDHLPEKGVTVTNAQFMQVYGGKGANQAVGAARAGGDVAFVSCLGNDSFAPIIIQNFAQDGINTSYVFMESDIPTGTALIMIGDKGENYLSVAPGANYRLNETHIDKCEDLLKKAEIIVIQYEILPESLAYLIKKAAKLNTPVLWNFAPARDIDISLLSLVDILVVNEVEAEFLTGTKVSDDNEIELAAEILLEKGIKTVIITLGSQGSYIATKMLKKKLPAFKVEAVDTTAAGDVYCGCLAVALTEGKPIDEAVLFASAAAALSVTKLGAQPSAPYRSEIDHFLNKVDF